MQSLGQSKSILGISDLFFSSKNVHQVQKKLQSYRSGGQRLQQEQNAKMVAGLDNVLDRPRLHNQVYFECFL